MISGLGRWLSCVALLGVLGGQARAAVPVEVLDLAMQPPVVNTTPGPEYSEAQRDYAMTIGLERTRKGRLWAAWVGGGDSDKGYFVAASSDDEGRTWSPPRFVIDPPDVPNGLRRRILVGNFWCDPTGRLWLFFDQSMGYFDGRAGAWAITCENPDAANPAWSAPRRLWHGATLNKPTVLKNGDWLMPVSLWTRDRIGPKELREGFRELDEMRMANWFASTDKGATWTRRGGVVVPQSDFDEHMCVELKDGRLWMQARTKYGIAETFSSDAGRTWTEPKATAIQNPSARFFLRRLASGRILLVKNGPLDQRTGRTQMSAFLSADEGRSWQGGLVFEERNGVSYPDGFQAPDGRIFISYDRERAKEREILMAVFTEADVLAGKAVSTEARLKVLISKALGPAKEAAKAPPAANARVKILFDTDMMTDCDDAGAMAVLHALADLGECEILATVASVGDPKSIATVDAINRYYGRPGLPLGLVKAGGVQQKSLFTARVAAEFPHGVKSGEEIADATRVYREVLEKQPDQSVVIVTVGYLTNLKNLLQLPASEGHLSGPDLIRRKVKTWVCMGGNFIGLPPKDDLKLGNVNFQRDAASALAVIQQWPGPVVFAGREVCSVPSGLAIGASLAKTPTNNPVRSAYEHYFGGTAKNRHVADLATVLYAVRGLRDYWNLSEPGRMDLHADMTFQWKFTVDGNQRYLLKRQRDGQPNDRYVEAALDELLVQPPRAAEPPFLPPGRDAKAAADRVLAGLVNVSGPEVKGAHDAEMTIVNGRAYIVAEANDVKAGEAPSWPFIYATMSVVNVKTLAVEQRVLIAKGEQIFTNEKLPPGACFVPRVLRKDARTLRCFFTSEEPGKRQSQVWFRDFDMQRGAFADTIHRAQLKTAAGTFPMQPKPFYEDAVKHGFKREPKDYGLYIFDPIKVFDGKHYAGINNYAAGQNALATLNAVMDTFEVIGHFNEPGTMKLTEPAVNRLPDGTWMAICRQEAGNQNYTFTTSRDGVRWTTNEHRSFVTNGAASRPTFDRFNGVYYLGWQERTRIAGVSRSVFNLDVSRDGATWERKYRFETVKSFQYPTFREHGGVIYVSVTQGDSDASRKERIMFGRLE